MQRYGKRLLLMFAIIFVGAFGMLVPSKEVMAATKNLKNTTLKHYSFILREGGGKEKNRIQQEAFRHKGNIQLRQHQCGDGKQKGLHCSKR